MAAVKPSTGAGAPGSGAGAGSRGQLHDQIVGGTQTAQKAAAVNATGKPSYARSTVGGAAGGAAAGAAVGSVVPGVGTAIGAGVGAVVGGAGGALKAHGQKSEAHKAAVAARGSARNLIVAEFVVCMVLIALAPLTDRHKLDGPTAVMRRGAAVCVLFLVLGLVATAGKGATRVAAALGGLVTLSLLVSGRDVLTALAAKFNSTTTGAPAGPGGEGDTSQGSGPSGSGEIDSSPQQSKGGP